jgi:hypothetical protein
MPIYLLLNKLGVRYYDIEALFLRTFLPFWPLELSNTSLNIAIDAEVATSREVIELRDTLDVVRSLVPGGVNSYCSHLDKTGKVMIGSSWYFFGLITLHTKSMSVLLSLMQQLSPISIERICLKRVNQLLMQNLVIFLSTKIESTSGRWEP